MGTIIGEGITFDDVLLVPQYSEVTPNMIELQTHLTKNGYSHRIKNGYRNGQTGWYRNHPQKYVY